MRQLDPDTLKVVVRDAVSEALAERDQEIARLARGTPWERLDKWIMQGVREIAQVLLFLGSCACVVMAIARPQHSSAWAVFAFMLMWLMVKV